MLDYLLQHAAENVWCSPDQDRQSIIKPVRLSHVLGAVGHQQVMWNRVALPTKTDYYHVFQIGQIHPNLLGLMPVTNEWMRLSDVINSTTLMAEVYLASGLVFPRTECWLRYDRHRNLILAIEDLKLFPQFKTESPYLRVYSNAFFESSRANAATEGTFVEGMVVGQDSTEVLNFQRRFHTARDKEGTALAYHNGWLIDDLVPSKVTLGDRIEYVYDSSVYRVLDFDVAELDVFLSTLDSKNKYLLNYPENNNFTIDYKDDIDLYLIKKDGTKFKGVYYYQNKFDAIRMLSHKDYSVPVDYIQGFADRHAEWVDINDLTVRLYVRKSGLERELVQEHNRLFELYRMEPEKVRRAMLGVDSTVPEWRAENLEASAYTALMRHRNSLMSAEMVQDAYGYNAVSRLVGDTPQRTRDEGGMPVVDLLPGQYENVTAYEYDANGLLLGYYHHSLGYIYHCQHANTKLVEIIVGQVAESLDATYGEAIVTTDPRYNYRVYLSTRLIDNLLFDWVDISKSELVSGAGGQLTLSVDTETDYPAVISDKKFLGYQMSLPIVNGALRFSVMASETHLGQTSNRPVTIPPQRLDLWLNGYSLIEGLDYYVKWPEVVIVNKNYLNIDGNQLIDVRCTGFCNEDMTLAGQREFGFVEHGYLSADRRYNVRDDKVLSMVLAGKLTHRDTLAFAEDNSGVSVNNTPNGTPYSIRETVVPMRGELALDTYTFRDRSIAVDKNVEDYLTQMYPEPEIPEVSAITGRYEVYSPFMARLIHDLANGILSDEPMRVHYSNADVYKWVEPYNDYLDFDPSKLGVDENYVFVHPHRFAGLVQLNIYQYNFIRRVNKLLFNEKLPLSQFIEVILPQSTMPPPPEDGGIMPPPPEEY